MTRDDAITSLFNGLTAMERGHPNPFPVPSKALTAYQYCYGAIELEHYRKFVCAVILGYYDDVIKEW